MSIIFLYSLCGAFFFDSLRNSSFDEFLLFGVFRRGNKPPVLPGENKKASAKEKPL